MTTDASKSSRNRTIALVALGAVAVLAIPGRIAWSMRSSAQAKTKDVKAQTEQRKAELAKARSLKAKEPALQQELSDLQQAMPVEPDQSAIVEQLAAVAREANVKWTVFDSPVPDGAKAGRVAAASTPSSAAAGSSASAASAGASAGDGTSGTKALDGANGGNDALAGTTTGAGSDGQVDTAASAAGFTFDAVVIGNEGGITAFLEKVRNIKRLVVIDKLTFSWPEATAGDQSDAGVRVRMTLRSFTWAGGKSATTATTANVAGSSAQPTTTVKS